MRLARSVGIKQVPLLWWALHQVPDSAPQLQAAAAEALAECAHSIITYLRRRNAQEEGKIFCGKLLYTCAGDDCTSTSYYTRPRELLQVLEASLEASYHASSTPDQGAVARLAERFVHAVQFNSDGDRVSSWCTGMALDACVQTGVPKGLRAEAGDSQYRLMGSDGSLSGPVAKLQRQGGTWALDALADAYLPPVGQAEGQPQGPAPPAELVRCTWVLARAGYASQTWFDSVVQVALTPELEAKASNRVWAELWAALAAVRHRPDDRLYCKMLSLISVEVEATADRRDAEGVAGEPGGQEPSKPARWLDAVSAASILRSVATLGVPADSGRLPHVLLRCVGGAGGRANLDGQTLAECVLSAVEVGSWVGCSPPVRRLLEELVGRWERGGYGLERDKVPVGQGLVALWRAQLELEAWERAAEGKGGASRVAELAQLLRGAGQQRGSRPRLVEAMEARARREQQLEAEKLAGTRGVRRVVGARRAIQRAGSWGAEEGGFAVRSVTVAAPVDELCCAVGVLVEMEGGRRVAVEVEGPREHLGARAVHPHTHGGGAAAVPAAGAGAGAGQRGAG